MGHDRLARRLLACRASQVKCPVKINTGELIKQLRSEDMAQAPRASAVAMVRDAGIGGLSGLCSKPECLQSTAYGCSPLTCRRRPAGWPQKLADNFSSSAWAMNKLLNVVNVAHSVLGPWPLKAISSTLNKVTGHMVPEWNTYMPKASAPPACAPVPDARRRL
jgi:D-lactate dehydrogenase